MKLINEANDAAQLAIVEFDPHLIETLYWIHPKIHIIIVPYSIYQVVISSRQMESAIHDKWQEEIAATKCDRRGDIEQKETLDFLDWFYQAKASSEAYQRYIIWQAHRPLNDTMGDKVIDLFETYQEEVFNYFKYRSMLKKL